MGLNDTRSLVNALETTCTMKFHGPALSCQRPQDDLLTATA